MLQNARFIFPAIFALTLAAAPAGGDAPRFDPVAAPPGGPQRSLPFLDEGSRDTAGPQVDDAAPFPLFPPSPPPQPESTAGTAEPAAEDAERPPADLDPQPYDGPEGIQPGRRWGGRPLILYRNEMVERVIRYYLEEKRPVLERGYRRAGRYLEMIRRLFAEEGVPPVLAYLAAVESNFNPRARSPARAVGMWQFTAPTARKFGLRIYPPWYDERMDPEASTRAAARLLAYLYDRYDDWALALAAYNAGENRVNQALEWALANGTPRDYWSLRLPKQTRGFVPAFLAVAAIMKAPALYALETVEQEPPLRGEVVELSLAATLEDVADRLRLTGEEMERLNPAWKGRVIPPFGLGRVLLRVPPGSVRPLLASLEADPPAPIPWLVHRVEEGDTVTRLASRFGVKTREILALNGLNARSLIYIGRRLLIPVTNHTDGGPPAEEEHLLSEESPVPALAQLHFHRVKSGESLWSISRHYGVMMGELRRWNDLGRREHLQPEEELLVFLR